MTVDQKGTVSVLRGRGDGSFRRPLTYQPTDDARYPEIEAVDVNGDGRPDLVIADRLLRKRRGWVDVLLNDGAGHFGHDQRYATDDWINALVAADLNSDAIVDLITAHPGARLPELSVLLGTGAGRFAAARSVIGRGVGDVAVGEFNGDGKPDVALPATLREIGSGSGSGTATGRSAPSVPSGRAVSPPSRWPISTTTAD